MGEVLHNHGYGVSCTLTCPAVKAMQERPVTTPDLAPEQRETLAGAFERAVNRGDASVTDAATTFTSVVARVVADAEQRGREEALKEVADAWQFGGWTELASVRVATGGIPALAYGQAVTDWLRARAEEQQ